jgi:uncharacterized protein YfdQ (DUF2303 family)
MSMSKEGLEKLEQLVLGSANTFNPATAIEQADDGNVPSIITPSSHHLINLESLLEHPLSMRGTMNTSRIDSFASYVGAHKTSMTAIFVDDKAMTAVAIIDHCEPDTQDETIPGWGRHKVVLKLEPVAAYKAICLSSPTIFNQIGFIDFLYDWEDVLEFYKTVEPSDAVQFADAIKNIRKIDIKSAGLSSSENSDFGHKATAMESVELSQDDPPPGSMKLFCIPYVGLSESIFTCRIYANISKEKCVLSYRVIAHEAAVESMVAEFTDILAGHRDIVGIPLHNGSFIR